ncbi:hypothetical protein TBLA_0E04740 [Henningerozyma blattae CBS 6284]|uniref:3-hydroxy-3-methylglutaryl coenzyme A reductase n=1 Tax=Henningerozyma blattae (strain ATCC 34711 / CBS 6284 / DSM 70876 / NBRC 10599 / NRRL Y-10934 / UCD 77-7) TaxID=1071380 RepID=I2H574_HENB6|nr:hypothetical protein TBLA_0E04740 [Tetrapisispora blattae CBS 6284]CCH61526.1 hypothetical protein TBLA_0E04740 [Tetrapisispora blattae CBS 6284]
MNLNLVEFISPLTTLCAHSAKFSARYPIHVILVSLLFFAATYLSVIQYYFDGWKLDSTSIFASPLPDLDFFFDDCTHYCRKPYSNIWNVLETEDARSMISLPNHYYLLNLQFKTNSKDSKSLNSISFANDTTTFPELNGLIFDSNDHKYLLQQEPNIPFELISSDGKKWRLVDNGVHFFELQHLALSLYNNFISRIQSSKSFDIFIIGSAYMMVVFTVYKLFREMNKIGSKFSLSLATMTNSACALFLALYSTQYITKTPVSALSLIEGLPFLVVTFGFKHQVNMARYTLGQFKRIGLSKKSTPERIVFDAIKAEGSSFIYEHLLSIVAFVGCTLYASHLEALKNFCILCSFIATYEVLFTMTLYSAVLSLKLEIDIIHRSTVIKQALEEDGIIPMTADLVFGAENTSKNSKLKSNFAVYFIKGALTILFLGINLYNFGLRWASQTVNFFYNNPSPVISLPEFIQTSSISILDETVLISVTPVQYYQQLNMYHMVEDGLILLLRYFSIAISDRLVSKVLIFLLIISLATNISLLNATRIHTKYTAAELNKKKTDSNNFKSLKSNSSNLSSEESEEDTNNSTSNNSSISNSTKATDNKIGSTKQKKKNTKKSGNNNINKSDKKLETKSITDDEADDDYSEVTIDNLETYTRPLTELQELMKSGEAHTLKNKEVVSLVVKGKMPLYALEKQLKDSTRAVKVRRQAISLLSDSSVLLSERLPYKYYDYDRVLGACCENVIGYMPIPVGIIGPLIIDDISYHIPMATTEGCLVASAMRGCKAINAGGGVTSVLTKDGMTRGPCVRFPSLKRAGACKLWLDSEEGQNKVKKEFNSTSRFARLQHIQTALAGNLLFIRFRTTTGDAMGMNMISKGVEFSLKKMIDEFGWDDMEVISVSGNYCTDKKPAAINWIEGRGKSIVAESIIPKDVVEKVLKSNVKALVELNVSKNLVGSAMAGSVGGFNAHAANLVTAVFLALGQDPAQNIESSNCITLMNETLEGDLNISVSMPSIEVGTLGGGTILEPQGSMLDMLGVRGPHPTNPGANAGQLAKIVASVVLAGELSLCSALAAGHLVQSHMTHNRAKPATAANGSAPAPAPAAINNEELTRLKEGSVTCIKS